MNFLTSKASKLRNFEAIDLFQRITKVILDIQLD